MPKKIRELMEELLKAGFYVRGGKGSHRRFRHPSGAHVTLAGNAGDDAKPYQEKNVKQALSEVKK